VLEKGWMSEKQLAELLRPEVLTSPSRATLMPPKNEK
jgi:hypothetical protein